MRNLSVALGIFRPRAHVLIATAYIAQSLLVQHLMFRDIYCAFLHCERTLRPHQYRPFPSRPIGTTTGNIGSPVPISSLFTHTSRATTVAGPIRLQS